MKSGYEKKINPKKEAIAIGLSEARKAWAKVPKKKALMHTITDQLAICI
nr:DUF6496 domain-containing protein [Pedobacter panaciterrae]